jgi:DNA-binding MarR family transcriptional regulator
MNNQQLAPIIIGKLLNIGGMLQRYGNRTLIPFDLNQQQFSILFEIVKARKVKQKEMVNRLILEKAHVSKVVKKLHKMELITITESDEDKRSYWLTPTPKGVKVTNDSMRIFEKWNKEWVKTIDEKKLKSIVEYLTLLQTVFENKTQK